jgi:hypothetical protein
VATRYSSFLVRFYLLERGERIEVEHVQTGAKTRMASLEAATIWMRTQIASSAHAPHSESDGSTARERREQRADRTEE